MRRHEIKDEVWERIKKMLLGQIGDPSLTAKDNRLAADAVFWIVKTGIHWRQLPERIGLWGRSGSGSITGPRSGMEAGFRDAARPISGMDDHRQHCGLDDLRLPIVETNRIAVLRTQLPEM